MEKSLPDDDQELLNKLSRLGHDLGEFASGVYADALSIDEQLDFGYQLINVAAHIRTRVEKNPAFRPVQDGDV